MSIELDKSIVTNYFNRYNSYTDKYSAIFKQHSKLDLLVIIPSKNENYIHKTILSLNECETEVEFGVVVIINASETDADAYKNQNIKTLDRISEMIGNVNFPIEVILDNRVPEKLAGVGYARKLGMDLALRYYGNTNRNGIIVNLDADCLVERNYIQVIYKAFSECFEEQTFATINFMHRKTDSVNENEAITQYELFLRYYVNGLKFANYPFHMHTIGSCIAVRASAYALHGGMNKKKAGEDFYFIHKLAPDIKHIYVSDTMVHPSARRSDRVPFGTGASINKIIDSGQKYKVYDPNVFLLLKKMVEGFTEMDIDSKWKSVDPAIDAFLEDQKFYIELDRIQKNTSGSNAFKNHLFKWLNGFRVLKFIHFASANYYPRMEIQTAGRKLLLLMGIKVLEPTSAESLLRKYQILDGSVKEEINSFDNS